MEVPTSFTLNNGHKLPSIGLGTFQSNDDPSKVKSAVKLSLELGYRHIDCADAYGNEKEVGEAIKESGVPRHEIFVTTKLVYQVSAYANLLISKFPMPILRAKTTKQSDTQVAMERDYPETWKAMEKLVDLDKARSIALGKTPERTITLISTDSNIGLSNFNILKTKRILEIARIRPAVNQVEIHPYFPQKELFQLSSKNDILLMAHQPLGGRPLDVVRGNPDRPLPTEDPEACKLRAFKGVCLSWIVQRGIPAVPKSSHALHMAQNIQLKRLGEGDLFLIDRLSSQRGPARFLDPSRHLGFDIFDEESDQPVDNQAPWD
ncbi:hypothetical protein N7456_010406 [Penicillium angulare]|uniref:D-xylose reductase [NAD(P)H] n=1 Tax=Penicillium angulare TaxID=116970 RepID=A0A9W9K6G9_9EURO|nr:hypothetical protein N7456_010406 [Penicillium angulare]